MTSLRAISEVKATMESIGLHPVTIELGEVVIEETLSQRKYNTLQEILSQKDFELIKDKESIIIEKTKNAIIEMIHHTDELPTAKYSDYISKKLGINYTSLSKLFSRVRHVTIEQFIIAHKIERVKHLLLFNDHTVSEIAWKLRYSSTAHLSAQFKKVTGLSPSNFRKLKKKKLIPLERI